MTDDCPWSSQQAKAWRDEVRRRLRISAQAKVRKSKRSLALKGDTFAAASMLRDAKNALDALLSGHPLQDFELIALEYLRDGLRDCLEGVPLPRALGTEKEGRGRTPLPEMALVIRDGLVALEVRRRLEKAGGTGKMTIYRAVARQHGISVSRVRDIMKNTG